MDGKKFADDVLFAAVVVAGGFLVQPLFPLGSLWWAFVMFVALAGLAWNHRHDIPFFDRTRNLDPFRRMTASEVARKCARFRPWKHKYWLSQLEQSYTWEQIPITEETDLALAEWVRIVHGICTRNKLRMPKYFRKAMRILDASAFDQTHRR